MCFRICNHVFPFFNGKHYLKNNNMQLKIPKRAGQKNPFFSNRIMQYFTLAYCASICNNLLIKRN